MIENLSNRGTSLVVTFDNGDHHDEASTPMEMKRHSSILSVK
jgi:hypothetical protein